MHAGGGVRRKFRAADGRRECFYLDLARRCFFPSCLQIEAGSERARVRSWTRRRHPCVALLSFVIKRKKGRGRPKGLKPQLVHKVNSIHHSSRLCKVSVPPRQPPTMNFAQKLVIDSRRNTAASNGVRVQRSSGAEQEGSGAASAATVRTD